MLLVTDTAPAVEAQAIDRTHRIGQSSQVFAYRLIAKNTVEQKIRALQEEKAALARAIIQEETLSAVLNLEDLRAICNKPKQWRAGVPIRRPKPRNRRP